MSDSIWEKLKPPTSSANEEIEEVVFPGKLIEFTEALAGPISLLEDAKASIMYESEEVGKAFFHINKAIRILKVLKREEELKNEKS